MFPDTAALSRSSIVAAYPATTNVVTRSEETSRIFMARTIRVKDARDKQGIFEYAGCGRARCPHRPALPQQRSRQSHVLRHIHIEQLTTVCAHGDVVRPQLLRERVNGGIFFGAVFFFVLPPHHPAHTARSPRMLARTIRFNKAGKTSGISQARNRTARAFVVRRPVTIPPSGPQRRTWSFRITRTRVSGLKACDAVSRTRASMVWPSMRNRALSRPMRVLKPPARMQTSSAAREIIRA